MDSLNPHREHNLPPIRINPFPAVTGSCSLVLFLLSFFFFFSSSSLLPHRERKLSNKHPWPWLTNTAAVHKLVIPTGKRERKTSASLSPSLSGSLPFSMFFPPLLFFSRVAFDAISFANGPLFRQRLPFHLKNNLCFTLALYFYRALAMKKSPTMTTRLFFLLSFCFHYYAVTSSHPISFWEIVIFRSKQEESLTNSWVMRLYSFLPFLQCQCWGLIKEICAFVLFRYNKKKKISHIKVPFIDIFILKFYFI